MIISSNFDTYPVAFQSFGAVFLLLPEAIGTFRLVENVGRELLTLSVACHGTNGHRLRGPIPAGGHPRKCRVLAAAAVGHRGRTLRRRHSNRRCLWANMLKLFLEKQHTRSPNPSNRDNTIHTHTQTVLIRRT